MSHLDDAVIAEYLDTAVISRDDERHLGDCASCRARVEEAVGVRERARVLLRAGTPVAAPPPFAEILTRAGRGPTRRRPAYRTLAWAATVALAAGLGWYGRAWLIPEPAPVTEAMPVAPAMVATADVPAAEPYRAEPAPVEPVQAAPRTTPVATADLGPLRVASGAGASITQPLTPPPAPARELAVRQAELEPVARRADVREERARADGWRTVTIEEAQTLLGGDLQTVEGLRTLGYAVRAVRGGVEVRTQQRLASGAILELLQRRALETALEADAVRRGEFMVTGRASIPLDSLRALLLRLH